MIKRWKRHRYRFLIFLAILGPGIITANVDNDAGGIATYSVCGANFGNVVAEFAGVAASMEIFGISKYISVPLSAIFVWWLVVRGTYRTVEKVLLIACLFYVTYLISGFLAR